MKHIKEQPAPLPADLPPNVRELIEITLAKEPGQRYRTGGAVRRRGRRGARRPTPPAAQPCADHRPRRPRGHPVRRRRPARPPTTAAGPPTAARPRPADGQSPHPAAAARTFSPGQRALLWAAGVLGALAIVIAILIVLNAQDRKDKELPPPTVTNTSTTVVPPPPPASPGAMPGPEWLDPGPIGNGGDNSAASVTALAQAPE